MPYVGISFLFQTQCGSSCPAYTCESYGTWPNSLLRRGQGPQFCSIREVHARKLPCIDCWLEPTGPGGPVPSSEANLALSPLM